MLYGEEASCGNTIVDRTWVVPHKFYSLSKVKMWRDNSKTSGFEVTFSPPASFNSEWTDISEVFGFQWLNWNEIASPINE